MGFVGARLGALVAARVARGRTGAPLALWEPVTDPFEVIEQAAKARGARPRRQVARNGPALATTSDLTPAPAAVGGDAEPAVVDVLDTPLGADLADGAVVAGLVEEMGDRPRPLLVVQTAPGHVLRPQLSRFVDRCHGRGLAADHVCHPCDGQRDGVPVPASTAQSLVDDTATWLISHLTAGLS